jgi:OmpA-OmpF porin, OOP family
MAELFDLLKKVLDNDVVGALAGRLGLGADDASKAIGVGLPTLLGGLAHHASEPSGANELLDRIRHTDGGKNLDGLLEKLRGNDAAADEDSAGFVEKILGGGATGGILEGLAGRLGLGKGVAGGLLGSLLPMVLGSLGKLGGLGGLSPSRLLGFLNDGAGAAADAAPGGRAGIASLLGPIGGALGLAGVGAATASAATGSGATAEAVHASAAAPSTPAPSAAAVEDEDRDRKGGFPWWLLAAAVLALGVIVAFANKNDGATAPVAGTPTTTTDDGSGTSTDGSGTDVAEVSDATPAVYLTARATGDSGITLDGPVADDATKSALADAATTVFGAGGVDDQLRVEAGAAGPANEIVEATLGALATAPRGWTAIWGAPDALTLIGEVASDADKTAIVDAATKAFAPGTVIDKLTVASAQATDGNASPEIDAINKEIRLRGVNFVTGSADLTPASRSTLDRIAKILAGATDVRAQVQGHTDNQGEAAANQQLSQRRAASVVAYLVGKGIAADRLVARGFGESRPIAPNATDAGRAKNRRVVFRRIT